MRWCWPMKPITTFCASASHSNATRMVCLESLTLPIFTCAPSWYVVPFHCVVYQLLNRDIVILLPDQARDGGATRAGPPTDRRNGLSVSRSLGFVAGAKTLGRALSVLRPLRPGILNRPCQYVGRWSAAVELGHGLVGVGSEDEA